MDNKRRSSTGRSKILEISIMILSEFIKSKDLEDIYGSVINNTLPGELRSTAWRIFLGILNKDDSLNWAKTTKSLRDNYYKLSKQADENALKFLKSELNDEQAKSLLDEKTIGLINTAKAELKQISNNFDFFKSEIISELVIRLVYLWSIAHSDFQDYQLIVEIVAGIVYSLYPSILHIDINMLGIDEEKLDNLEIKNIFYYLNTEEHFDADVYTIFDCLMSRGFKNFISSQKEYKSISPGEIQDIVKIDDDKVILENAKKLNKIDRIFSFYLRLVNPEMLTKVSADKNELYQALDFLVSTILTKHLNSETIIYIWDCIFINEIFSSHEKAFSFENDFFLFIDYILLSYLILNQDNAGKTDFVKIFLNSLQTIDGRDVVKKAIKLREKINNIYS